MDKLDVWILFWWLMLEIVIVLLAGIVFGLFIVSLMNLFAGLFYGVALYEDKKEEKKPKKRVKNDA